jgi:hypothetical protein
MQQRVIHRPIELKSRDREFANQDGLWLKVVSKQSRSTSGVTGRTLHTKNIMPATLKEPPAKIALPSIGLFTHHLLNVGITVENSTN